MTTGADYFAEYLRIAKIAAETVPEHKRMAVITNAIMASALLNAAHLQNQHDYETAHDLIATSANFLLQVHEIEVMKDDNARRFAAEAVARAYGIEIPDTTPPPIEPTYGVEDREAAFAWAIATVRNADSPPTKSAWLPCDDICCFGGSPEACGQPIDGVMVLLEDHYVSAATYCHEHGPIMQEAIERVRSEAGALSNAELAELGIHEEGDAVL